MSMSVGKRSVVVHLPVQQDQPTGLLNQVHMTMPDNYSPDVGRHSLDHYHSIGRGTQATVIGAQLQNGKMRRVAAKRYKMDELKGDKSHKWLMRELQNTQYLVHPHIVRCLDTFYEKDQHGKLLYTWIVTERMETTLDKYFKRLNAPEKIHRPRDHRHIAALMTQLFMALDFLHHRGVMHRDLNPKNVGLNLQDFKIKILDFGCSGLTDSDGLQTTKNRVGTPPLYRPPELLVEHVVYDSGVDVWAVALIAVEMLGNKLFLPRNYKQSPAFNQEQLREQGQVSVLLQILTILGLPEHRYVETFHNHFLKTAACPSQLAYALVEPLNRLGPDSSALTKSDLQELLCKILIFDPRRRPTPAECLRHPYLSRMHDKYRQTAPIQDGKSDLERLDEMLQLYSKKLEPVGNREELNAEMDFSNN
ncbi:unnamed protein product, partial [Mesorhabditis spiculigera]